MSMKSLQAYIMISIDSKAGASSLFLRIFKLPIEIAPYICYT